MVETEVQPQERYDLLVQYSRTRVPLSMSIGNNNSKKIFMCSVS